MITFIPKRPDILTSPMLKPSPMAVLAYDMAYEEYCLAFQHSFIKHNNDYWQAYNYAIKDALIALAVYLSFACEGVLYE